MRVMVLGKSPAWQDAGGACSGYVIEEQDTRLLLDCGSGSFAELRPLTDYVDVGAAVITHLHAKHFFDLVVGLNAGRGRSSNRGCRNADPTTRGKPG